MATLKNFHVLIMLVLQLLCLGFLAHVSTGEVIPHEFVVCLDEGYPLQSHFEYIGKQLNISRYIENLDCYDIDFHNTTTTHDLSEQAVLDLIRSDPQVYSVSSHLSSIPGFWVEGKPSPPSDFKNQSHSTHSRASYETLTQEDASWALSYVSSDQAVPAESKYYYMQRGGQGVDVYVLDTGLDPIVADLHDHRFFTYDSFVSEEPDTVDYNGHGTHVASIVGSDRFGVCKLCAVISLKTSNATGLNTSKPVRDAINYAIWRHNIKKQTEPGFKGSIINMSFGFNATDADLDDVRRAIKAADAAGILMVAAAGNDGMVLGFKRYTESYVYPATSGRVITVGGSLEYNTWFRSSNYGPLINVLAPASCESYWRDATTRPASGTSQAAPHVAGVLALWMSYEGSFNKTIASQRLMQNSDIGYISGVPPNTHNSFVNSGIHKGFPYVGVPEGAGFTD
ncbi:unnamed protein product [Aureobasidium mustum]|uniref:Peptidase S8/S53 domain-containing protein n=1 Tax=Aureobasidium mustum TaxID=2773714 RepID=A0A9N8PB80_9PEZI|nr:unnamed protein product [Aureobasidium mustum]